jgi:glyoxylase-like metal-dependent hydrolase (beta-lactamase superfamily II)
MEDIRTIRLKFVNAYLLRAGDGFIMIDTGMALQWNRMESELTEAGCLPDRLRLVILTHGDHDHAGNCKKLQVLYGTQIAMHKADAPMVSDGLIRKRKIKSFRNRIFYIIRAIFRKRFDHDKFRPDIYLGDGQSLSEYGLDATVYHLPGHTHGSIGILTGEGNFFPGDTFVNTWKPETARLIENQYELDRSMERIKKLNIKVVFPGHGMPFALERMINKI